MIDQDYSTPENKPQRVVVTSRKWWLAAILSLLVPGLGQLYNGQWKKAIGFAVALVLIPVTFGMLHLTAHFWGFIGMFFVAILFRLWILIDAIRTAIPLKAFELNNYNHGVIYFGMILIYQLIFAIYDIRTVAGVNSFYIPMASGEPTIQTGDYVVADISAYNDHDPEYGDIIVFRKSDGQTYFYRVIGLPNDRLKIEADIPVINGKKCAIRLTDEFIPDPFNPFPNERLQEWEEILPNGHVHKMQKYTHTTKRILPDVPEIRIPRNSYFVMGDNRGNAADSRFIGYIKREDISGQIVFSVWGKDGSRMGVDFRKE